MNEFVSGILEGAGAFFIGLLFLAWLAVTIKKFVYQYMYEHVHTPEPEQTEPTLSMEDRSFINELIADL